jgi:hypothetical protein
VIAALDGDLAAIGVAARARVLGGHTAAHRAAELEQHLRERVVAEVTR